MQIVLPRAPLATSGPGLAESAQEAPKRRLTLS